MNKARVSIVRAYNYDYAEIHAAVVRGIELIGGLAGVVPAGSKVFVKINHISPPSPPEKGIVTHPVFVEAVLACLKEAGADITVGDDISSSAGDGFRVSGFRQMCQRANVRLVNLREAGFVEVECHGHFLEKVYLARAMLDADVIVNLPKLKTHSLCVLTCGVKNLYGVIPSGLRQRLHGEYTKCENFSQMLVDIFSAVKPQLNIVDGIVAMEGEGPAAGSLRPMGVILASRDAVALDAVSARIIGLDPMDVDTTRYAHERGLGVGRLEDIEVVGERVEDVSVPDFKLPAGAARTLSRIVPHSLVRFAVDRLFIRPSVVESRCTGCAECEKICPSGAISVSGKKARINHAICLQCMCCHEVCRFNAIKPRQSIVGRMVQSLTRTLRRLLPTGI